MLKVSLSNEPFAFEDAFDVVYLSSTYDNEEYSFEDHHIEIVCIIEFNFIIHASLSNK
jgi:hypothetical protein